MEAGKVAKATATEKLLFQSCGATWGKEPGTTRNIQSLLPWLPLCNGHFTQRPFIPFASKWPRNGSGKLAVSVETNIGIKSAAMA